MPRESRKISSRNQRRAERNVALSSIREMLHHSSASNRYSPFSRDTPRRSPSASKNDTYRINESSVFTLTPRESPELTPLQQKLPISAPLLKATVTKSQETIIEASISSSPSQEIKASIAQDKTAVETKSSETSPQLHYKNLVQHGIHYIMLPINLLQFCVWGNKTGAILPPSELKKYVSDVEETSKAAEKPEESSPNDSKNSEALKTAIPQVPSVLNVPHVSGPQAEDHLDLSTDEESDEMVTANESSNDSSTDYSSAKSTAGSMNMSIDFANNNFEKHNNLNIVEEPMEVTITDPNSPKPVKPVKSSSIAPKTHVAGIGSILERQRGFYSSGSSSEYTWSDGVSSVDREIAGIFARACTSSSSSDEEASDFDYLYSGFNNRKLGTPLVRRRRICEQSPKTPSKGKPRPLRKKNSPLVKSGGKSVKEKLPSATDSAYSDEELRMSFHESYLPVPSIPIIESMDQDFEYGGDTEDSNDGVASLRPRILTYEGNVQAQAPIGASVGAPVGAPYIYARSESSGSRDQGFEEREDALLRNAALMQQQEQQRNAALMQRERLQKWSDTFSLDKSMLHLQIARNSSELSGFSQFGQGTVCSCGNPACYPVPIGFNLPQIENAGRTRGLTEAYPPAPTPLPHLYYQYPEFMSQPNQQFNNYPKYNVPYAYMNSFNQIQ